MKNFVFNISPGYPVFLFIIGLMLLNLRCIEEYNPNLDVNVNLLTINGSIVRGHEEQTVVISRSTPVDSTVYIPVKNCHVFVTNDNNNIFQFKETSEGKYTAKIDSSYLVTGSKFKLTVETPDKNIYESGFEEILACPPVDSLYFQEELNYSNDFNADEKGLRLYVNLQNKEGYAEYYRWTIDETWEYRSKINGIVKALMGFDIQEVRLNDTLFYPGIIDTFITDNDTMIFEIESKTVIRDTVVIQADPIYTIFKRKDSLYYCWQNGLVNGLYSTSTTNLVNSGKKQIPLHFIFGNEKRLQVRYCCMVNQYSLNEDAYNYWQNKQVEIQESGGMYFSQPSQTLSNIKNVNNEKETVLGYFWTSTLNQKRIFFDGPFEPREYILRCPADTFPDKR